ncbi:MAG TPA: efflux RND transporter periplasmic adaptor subunit [Steroidobacteraceae bacterium]|jgi:multidrug efflux system membrane fusion protein
MTMQMRAVVVCAACACAAAAVWGFGSFHKPAPAAPKAVPVRVVSTVRRDAPAYLSTIATVQAFNTVLVRPRVDGQISRVSFVEGAQVKRGDPLVELDRRPFESQLRAARAQKVRDNAQLENANRDLKRYESLIKLNSPLAAQTLDAARSQVAQLTAALEVDDAQVDQARLQLDYATIVAPIDGRAGARLVDVGNIVHASDVTGFVVLTQVHPIAVSFSLPQGELQNLRAQQARHALHVLAIDPTSERQLDAGELTLIDNQIDAGTGTIHCKAVFPNVGEALWPGQFVTARVLMENLADTVTVPVAAIQSGSRGPFVYIVDADRRAEIRDVQVGPTFQGEAAIVHGLNGGETVVVEGQFQLEPHTLVEPKNVAAAR